MKHICFFLVGIFVATATPATTQNRIFVHQQATGTNTGASWTDAFTDLHSALATAVAGDEVWVAEGTYLPDTNGDRSARFEILSGVRLYGGFAATELDLSERDWQGHPTVLDGDIGAPGDSTDNSRNLLYLFRPDSFTLVDGFFFRHAVADDSTAQIGSVGNSGAALYIMANNGEAYPAIRNCGFEHNTALRHGGAVYINGTGTGSAAPMFDNCSFSDNRAMLGNGGALYRNGGSWVDRLDIFRCLFEKNEAYLKGGGIYFADSPRSDTFDLIHTTWLANKIRYPDTVVALGAALHSENMRTVGATVVNIKNGISKGHYGRTGSITGGNPLSFSEQNYVLFIDTMEIEGTGVAPGEILGWGRCEIENIQMVNCEGLIHPHGATVADSHSIFKNIVVKEVENKFYRVVFQASSAVVHVANLVCMDSCNMLLIGNNGGGNLEVSNLLIAKADKVQLSVSHVTADKMSLSSSSILRNATAIGYGGSPNSVRVENNILLSNRTVFFPPSYLNQPVFSHNIFNFPDTFNSTNWIKTNNLFATDPQFVNPEAGDFRLRPCSPAINAGDNAAVVGATDILGNPRIRYGTVDIGAVEMGDLYFGDNAPAIQSACPGADNGSIDVSGLEVCPPVTYQWDAAPGNNTPQLSGLAPGAYTLTATDANGRTVVAVLSVPLGAPPALSPLPTPVLCGDTLGGSVAVSVSGATAPLAFDWGALGTDSLVANLPPGLYPVTVTDARGCTAVGSVEVDRSGNLGVDITAQPVSCHGSADGAFTVLPANGKAPFAWNWSNPPGAATPTVGPLGPGAYEGTLTDAFGCTIGWVLPLGQPAPLQPSAFVTDATDTAKADGAILLIPTGGTGPYSALWAGGQTGLLLDSLPPGAYSATVTDANGCTAATPTILVGVTTSAGEPDTIAGWQVLPNPATAAAAIVLDAPATTALPVRLWAADGRRALERVLFAGADRVVLEVGDLPRGMYFVQVGAAVRKLVLRG